MPVEPREIADDEVLSHYGTPGWSAHQPEEIPHGERGGFRGVPRPDRETGMSLILGELTPDEVKIALTGRPAREDDAVRHTTAGTLRAAGFVVVHTPHKWNTGHVTVEFPGPWDDDVTERWHDCFGSAISNGDSDG